MSFFFPSGAAGSEIRGRYSTRFLSSARPDIKKSNCVAAVDIHTLQNDIFLQKAEISNFACNRDIFPYIALHMCLPLKLILAQCGTPDCFRDLRKTVNVTWRPQAIFWRTDFKKKITLIVHVLFYFLTARDPETEEIYIRRSR